MVLDILQVKIINILPLGIIIEHQVLESLVILLYKNGSEWAQGNESNWIYWYYMHPSTQRTMMDSTNEWFFTLC